MPSAAQRSAQSAALTANPGSFTRSFSAGYGGSTSWNVEAGLQSRFTELRPQPRSSGRWTVEEVRASFRSEQVSSRTTFLPGGRAVTSTSVGIRAEVDKPFSPSSGLLFDGES